MARTVAQAGVDLRSLNRAVLTNISHDADRTPALGVSTPSNVRPRTRTALPFPVVILIFLAIMFFNRRRGGPGSGMNQWGGRGWSGWSSGVGPFGGGGGGWGGGGGGGFGGGFGGFGGGSSGGGGGGGSW